MRNNFFTTNLEIKLASILLATALWFFVMLSGRSEITMDIPIVFTNLPSMLEIVDSPPKISISLEGQERIIRNVNPSDVNATVDLSKIKEGRSFLTLSRDNINIPPTLVVTNIDPETISLKIEAHLKKSVTVKPYVVGLPEKGFVITEITVEPETIELEGPQSIIKKIRTVKTTPIDISGINSTLKYKANLDLSNSNIRKSLNKVEVNISVKNIEQ